MSRKAFIAGTVVSAFAAVLVGAYALAPQEAHAQGFSLLVDCARNQTATPGLDCVVRQFTNIARFILSITGSVALLIFVLAGFMYLLNAGNPEQAKKATSYITNAAIGLVIIFCSGILVNYLQRQLRDVSTTDAACASFGPEYSCRTVSNVNDPNCQPGLCLSNASPNYLCCKAGAGGGTNTTTPGAGGTQNTAQPQPTASMGCSNLEAGLFLGCTESNCQATGAPCQVLGVTDDCLALSGDIRCTTPGTPAAIYGCYSGTGLNRVLKGCAEVNSSGMCNQFCAGEEFCGFIGPNGTRPDQECIRRSQ